MNTTAMIVSIISVLGALILVTSNARFRELGARRMIRLGLIWVAIIVGLMLIIDVTGLRIQQ
ncbi:hypothetical protein [Novosphingobium pentaromativorans]|uniref:Uncharacterized protein n=1 Tax=Novosphingobium pentaromativorans US6-1 TaxID=1088721 RepID=G6EJ02_9SPHN|nr:hypothetical protein [Novosphingobium pentaromativorans]AIT78962.1 hypothetical protein JI59_03575 [Novosphingobium pentaromativorans US6-1]EHJ58761.1 hypothetical protein NSU_4323 [Novosphingobium pentaromativorans US6-1]